MGYELTWAKSYAQYHGLPVKRPRVYVPFTRVVQPQDALMDFQQAVNELVLDNILWKPGQHAREPLQCRFGGPLLTTSRGRHWGISGGLLAVLEHSWAVLGAAWDRNVAPRNCG